MQQEVEEGEKMESYDKNCLWHWGIKGQRWGVRRYQNPDGTLTAAGKKRYGEESADSTGQNAEAKPQTVPADKKKVSDYSDEELRTKINRLQMEKQYRDLQGQSNVREDDPNRDLKLQREKLQLERDVRSLKREINGGQTFVKSVMNDAGKRALTTMATGAMLYIGKETVSSLFQNPELTEAVAKGSIGGQAKSNKDDKS